MCDLYMKYTNDMTIYLSIIKIIIKTILKWNGNILYYNICVMFNILMKYNIKYNCLYIL